MQKYYQTKISSLRIFLTIKAIQKCRLNLYFSRFNCQRRDYAANMYGCEFFQY